MINRIVTSPIFNTTNNTKLMVQDKQISAPELLVPGKKPVGAVKVNWQKTITNKLQRALVPQGMFFPPHMHVGNAIEHSTTGSITDHKTVDQSRLVQDCGRGSDWYHSLRTQNIKWDTTNEVSFFFISAPYTSGRLYSENNNAFCGDGRIYYTIPTVSANSGKQRFTIGGVADYEADGFYLPSGYQVHGITAKSNGTVKMYVGKDVVYETSIAALGSSSNKFAIGWSSGASTGRGNHLVELFYLWTRVLSESEWKRLAEDPYQFLDPI